MLELSGKQYYRKSCILILGNEEDKDNAKSFKQEVLTLKIALTEHSDAEKKEDKKQNKIKTFNNQSCEKQWKNESENKKS